jgi:hypothetical protein
MPKHAANKNPNPDKTEVSGRILKSLPELPFGRMIIRMTKKKIERHGNVTAITIHYTATISPPA